jgi:hypothetical protein
MLLVLSESRSAIPPSFLMRLSNLKTRSTPPTPNFPPSPKIPKPIYFSRLDANFKVPVSGFHVDLSCAPAQRSTPVTAVESTSLPRYPLASLPVVTSGGQISLLLSRLGGPLLMLLGVVVSLPPPLRLSSAPPSSREVDSRVKVRFSSWESIRGPNHCYDPLWISDSKTRGITIRLLAPAILTGNYKSPSSQSAPSPEALQLPPSPRYLRAKGTGLLERRM